MLRETERERGFCCWGFFYSKTEMCPNEINIISEKHSALGVLLGCVAKDHPLFVEPQERKLDFTAHA